MSPGAVLVYVMGWEGGTGGELGAQEQVEHEAGGLTASWPHIWEQEIMIQQELDKHDLHYCS